MALVQAARVVPSPLASVAVSRPVVGATIPESSLIKVLLPAPLVPTIAVNPGLKTQEMPLRASFWVSGYVYDTPSSRMASRRGAGAGKVAGGDAVTAGSKEVARKSK